MARRRGLSVASLAAALLCASACQSAPPAEPAVLSAGDAETIAAVKVALARALGVASVELGPGDPTTEPTLAVLPPAPGPLEGRSLARPILFDIMLRSGRCYLVRRDSGQAYALDGVSCRRVDG